MASIEVRTNPTDEPDSTGITSIEDTVPFESDSGSPNSVNIVDHSTSPSQFDDLVDDEAGNSIEISKGTTENGVAGVYWETVHDFASDITRAARDALSNRSINFKKVVAVITYWENSAGLKHLRDQADELGKLFRDAFKFEVLIYKIPDGVIDWKLITIIGGELEKVSEEQDSLFILYYGGHAIIKDSPAALLWKKENRPKSPEFEWSSAMKTLFKTRVICRKLFLFDCCHAGGMIDSTLRWENSCELLGACGEDVQASALKVSSFTAALVHEFSNHTYDIWELHTALCSTDKRNEHSLAYAPVYQEFVSRVNQSCSSLIKKVGSPSECEDRPLKPSDKLKRLATISDAVICIAITFRCTAEFFTQEVDAIKKNWKRWFKFAPTEFDDIIVKACRGTDLIGVFDSNSCITIWSFPIWLWDAMAPLSGYQYIGTIRPQNFALTASGAQAGLAVPVCSSNMIAGALSSSSRPSKPDMLLPIQDTIFEGRTGEDDPHLESTKPSSGTTAKVEATSKPTIKNLPEKPVRSDTASSWGRVNRYLPYTSHKEKQEIPSKNLSNTPLSSSNSSPNFSRASTLNAPPALHLSEIPPRLEDLVHGLSEKRKASMIQDLKQSRGVEKYLVGCQQDFRYPDLARDIPVIG